MSNNWRIYFVFFLIVAMSFAIAGRVFYLQILKNGYYAALARGQQIDYDNSKTLRGEIFFQDRFKSDTNSEHQIGAHSVATNRDWPLLYAVPNEIQDAESVAEVLASFLLEERLEGEDAIDPKEAVLIKKNELYEKISDMNDSYEPIARKLDDDIAQAIIGLKIPGIYIKKEKARYYPAGNLASHILGFVGYRGSDRVGQYGVEGFYNEGYLEEGKSLELGIDYNIQFVLTEKLQEAVKRLRAEGGSGVVINPTNGQVIALAVIDEFDPNNYSQVESIDVFLNDISQKIFEPGSIFKPFTMAAAINEKAVFPSTKYKDSGKVTIGKYTIRNSDGKAYGAQSMTNVLERSLNTGVVFAEGELGHDLFREYMERFGFKKKTGVDLQGEVGGDIQNILRTSRDINFATASFGQGIALTPMQLATAFSAFANGGRMVKPHVVKEIINPDGSREPIDAEVIGEPVSLKTAAQITAMLVSAVENGYGKKARVPGYTVAGKTGTAQVPKERGRGYSEKTVHSFIGYAPAYDPKFLMLLKLDDPKDINFSADTVAPLFSEIAEYILNYYEIPPDS